MDEPRLHVEARGSGPPLALGHGFGGSARNFRVQARALSGRWRVIHWDARGHARSEAPADPAAFGLADLARDVGRVLDGEGAERAVVGGLSMGAAAALEFARRSPDRVRALVLASYPAPRALGGFARIAGPFAETLEREGAEAAGERFVWGPDSGLDPQGAAWVRQGFLEHDPHALAALLRGALSELPEAEDLIGELDALAIPTLLVAGGEDPGSLASHRALERALPDARSVVVPGAGHVVNLADPKAFGAALEAFLDAL